MPTLAFRPRSTPIRTARGDARISSLAIRRVNRFARQHQIAGALLGVLIGAPCIRTDDAEAERIERTEEQDDQHSRRIARQIDRARPKGDTTSFAVVTPGEPTRTKPSNEAGE